MAIAAPGPEDSDCGVSSTNLEGRREQVQAHVPACFAGGTGSGARSRTMKASSAAMERHEAGGDGAGEGTGSRTVPVTVTYLEMTSPEQRAAAPGQAEPTTILRAERPALSFYRYLYDTIGTDWSWYARRRLSDKALAAIIHDDRVEVFVLYVRGVPAGYVELDRRVEGEVEIAYFGLMPEYIGRGLGPFLLDWALVRAWSLRPRRVWLHTCSLDHPKALAVYRRAGFVAYDRETEHVDAELLDLSRQDRRKDA